MFCSVCPTNKLEGQGEVYSAVVIIYGADTWAMKKAQEKKLDVVEMGMSGWMCGVTKLDRIRTVRIRGTAVEDISKKVQEIGLKCYEHVLRREEAHGGKRVMAVDAPGK